MDGCLDRWMDDGDVDNDVYVYIPSTVRTYACAHRTLLLLLLARCLGTKAKPCTLRISCYARVSSVFALSLSLSLSLSGVPPTRVYWIVPLSMVRLRIKWSPTTNAKLPCSGMSPARTWCTVASHCLCVNGSRSNHISPLIVRKLQWEG